MDLYAENILEHYKHPRNFGLIADAKITGSDLNPLCGDKLTASLVLDDGDKISKFGFEGSGCAISMAAMSMLGEEILNKPIEEVENMGDERIYEMLGVEISPARVKCALLGLSCIKKMTKLYKYEKGKKD